MAETMTLAQQVLTSEVPGSTPAQQKPAKPTPPAVVASIVMMVIGGVIAYASGLGEAFVPRVKTLDALAGLTVGAFVVERLLNFVPPIFAHGARTYPGETDTQYDERIRKRSADIAFLRVGYGALLGGVIVMVTDLRAIKVLIPEGTPETLSAGWDRVLAAFAIAGGVAGLASLLGSLNPQTKTDPKAKEVAEEAGGTPDPKTIPPTSDAAYAVGLVAVAIAIGLAALGASDKTGLELIAPSDQGDGTVALVVRFGIVILLAGVIQQIVERTIYPLVEAEENRKVVTGAVALVLGVIAARAVDLFLLHDIGFFGVGADETIDQGLAASTGAERWFDAFITGVVIAAGTKPLHDLTAGLKKRTEKTDAIPAETVAQAQPQPSRPSPGVAPAG
jgi:hypothetical protein